MGLTRAGLLRLVLAETLVIGVVGSATGLAMGYALARLAVRAVGGDLGAGMFRGMTPEIGFPPVQAGLLFLSGLTIALLAGVLPALDAAGAAPARALKSGDEQQMFGRMTRAWPGVALIVAGGVLTRFGPIDGIPVFGYAAIAAILVGGILLMPFVAGRLLASNRMTRMHAPGNLRTPWSLAITQLRGAPGQAMVSLSAIVASFALMVAMAIMVASFRQSVDTWLEAVLPADYYFRTSHAGDTAFLDPEFAARVRGLPEVERAEFLRSERLTLDPARPAVSLIARDMPVDAGRALPLTGPAQVRRAGDPPSAWVSEAVAAVYGFAPGSQIKIALAGQQRDFLVSGVWRDYARQHGAIVIDRADYRRLTGDERINDAALWLRPGVHQAQIEAALRALPGGELLDMAGPGEIRKASLSVFDRSFALTYALEAVAVLVGLFGLSSSLGAIVLARKREFGMLRHIGMTRAQIGVMLAFEGGLLAAFGAAAGMAVGWVIGLILIHVVNRQSFNWGMELHPPYALLSVLTVVLVSLAVLTAWLSGREAMGIGPIRAVREDW